MTSGLQHTFDLHNTEQSSGHFHDVYRRLAGNCSTQFIFSGTVGA